ncbi:MOSC domain-containing protein [Aerophototrophica crusticola]|uniref:MOSC domain-containing protein n=1 Tax=Aerophototrophica crusticola TaxID=1709002 RepID=A0A858R7B8_9PROT|nr:MOSC domain-containing protein [Rhodospirillaceae bacterium B3]
MRVVGVYAGKVQTRLSSNGKPGDTGIAKAPVDGPVRVGPRGLEGDESAYRARDLGDTAVHAFCRESYAQFGALAGDGRQFPIPSFGENLSVEGYTEAEARVGDVLRVGTVLLRVNQPVVRCRWPTTVSGEPRISKWATQQGLTGWYMDVLEPGTLQAGDAIELVERGPEGWTILALNRILYAKPKVDADVRAALALPELADRWKEDLREALAEV